VDAVGAHPRGEARVRPDQQPAPPGADQTDQSGRDGVRLRRSEGSIDQGRARRQARGDRQRIRRPDRIGEGEQAGRPLPHGRGPL